MTLTHTGVHAFKWSVLAEIASRAMGAVVLLVLARLLVPEDFGVVAAATVVISLSQVFVDAGLDKALIQRQLRVEESANVVFWLNLGLGLIVALLLVGGSPWIADFFHDPRITPVIRVLALQVPMAALASVQTALLRKDLQFRRLFLVRLLTTGAGAVASIPLALLGFGYWSLVIGTLAGQAAQVTVLWLQSPWRPSRQLDRSLIRELTAFGVWAMASGLLGWGYTWLDAIVVGHYFGANDLGIYRTGSTFVSMIFGLIFWPLMPVLYSLFARAQNELPKLREGLQAVTHAATLIAFPLGAYLFAASGDLGDVVFGPRWQGVGIVIALMGIKEGIAWIVGANGEVYRAIGKPHIDTWVSASVIVVYLAGYLASVQFGLVTFLQARVGLALFGTVAHILVARSILAVPIRKWLHAGILVTSSVAAFVVVRLDLTGISPVLALTLRTALFAVIAAVGIALFERRFVRHLIGMVRPAAR